MAKAREPKVFRSMDDLPLMLTPYDLMDFLGKGQRQTYELIHSEGFPYVQDGPKIAILSGLGIKDRQKVALDQYGDLYYTKAASYDEYAKEVGLPSVKDMVNADNPKKYLRPGETLADLNRQVVRKRFNRQIITVPLGLDIHN